MIFHFLAVQDCEEGSARESDSQLVGSLIPEFTADQSGAVESDVSAYTACKSRDVSPSAAASKSRDVSSSAAASKSRDVSPSSKSRDVSPSSKSRDVSPSSCKSRDVSPSSCKSRDVSPSSAASKASAEKTAPSRPARKRKAPQIYTSEEGNSISSVDGYVFILFGCMGYSIWMCGD